MGELHAHDKPSGPFPGPDDHLDAWAELALDYQDGRLDADRTAAVERHLAGCSACATLFAEQQAGAQALHRIVGAEPPAVLERRILAEIMMVQTSGSASIVPPARAASVTSSSLPSRQPRRGLRDRLVPRSRAWLPAAAGVLLVAVALMSIPLARQATLEETSTTAAGITEIAEAPAAGAPSSGSAVTTAVTFGGETGAQMETSPDRNATDMRGDQGPAAVNQGPAAMTAGSGAALNPYVVRTYSEAPESVPPSALVSASLSLVPIPDSLWMEGPAFALFVPRADLDALLSRLDRTGLVLEVLDRRTAAPGSPIATLGHAWHVYPELVGVDVRDPLGQVFVNRGPIGAAQLSADDAVLLILTMTD